MGLRDFLMGAQQLQSGVDSYAQSKKDEDQKKAFQEFQQSAPDLIKAIRGQDQTAQSAAAAKYNNLAIRSGQAKNDPYAESISKFLFPAPKASGNVAPLTRDQIDAGYDYLPENVRQSASQVADPKTQLKMLGDYGTQNRSTRAFSLQNEKTNAQQGTTAFNKLDKTEDAFRDQDYKIKEIQQALKRGSSLDDNIVFGYIARSIAQEKGPLSDSDIKRIQGVTPIQGSVDEFRSKFNGDLYTKLSPDQKKHISEIVSQSAQNFQSKKAESIAADLNGLYQSQTRLKDDDGSPKGILKQRIDSYKQQGIPIDFDSKTKTFNVTKGKTTATGKAADLISAANTIKDPAKKAAFIKSLSMRSDQEITEDQDKAIRAAIKQAGGA